MFSDYIGIPFKDRGRSIEACDCYGLVRLIYKDLLNIELFNGDSSAFETGKIHEEYLNEVSKNWNKVEDIQKFDVVAMAHDSNFPSIIQHFGVIISNTKMIHTLRGVGSHVVNLDDYKYCIKGVFRYGKTTNV